MGGFWCSTCFGILTGVVQILAEPTLTMPLIGANGAIAGVLERTC